MVRARPGTLLLSGLADLSLGNTAHLLGPVLLLPLLSASPGLRLNHSLPQQPVFGLKLFSEVHGVVDEGEASGLAAAKLGLEAKGEAAIGGARVHLRQLLTHISLGHGSLAGVEDINHHLTPAEQSAH